MHHKGSRIGTGGSDGNGIHACHHFTVVNGRTVIPNIYVICNCMQVLVRSAETTATGGVFEMEYVAISVARYWRVTMCVF